MSTTPLFGVIISVDGDDDTGEGIYDVQIVDRYNDFGDVIGEKTNMRSLDEAMEFAKGAVTAFMEGTTA